jgi:hypothetical protein
MRWWVAALTLGIGCVQAVPPPASQPQREPENLIDGETYAARIAGLRATLARNNVAIDTQPMIERCSSARCVRCDVASRQNTGGVDPTLIDAVAFAFGAYPPSFIAATQLEHVALCRTIRIEGEEPPAGVALTDQHRLLISVEAFVDGTPQHEHFGISQVVHHEMFHLFDYATLRDLDREWDAINPPGFAYRDPAGAERVRPVGFVNPYATTNAREDRASVFEFLMGQPTKLCEIAQIDPIVKEKTKVVWKRVAKVVGNKILRQHAPCVDDLDRVKRKPPAKSAPRPKGLPQLRTKRLQMRP